ncbi:MAG: hypothetical protein BWK76_09600 [Desulfobulbaceae bacterium A2]|nr:MAG: hypothetical protein BWK76_09600 [Desulfobulbaceae bacterium A2]
MSKPCARGAALEILRRWGAAPAPLPPIVDMVLGRAGLDGRNRALALALVQETLRRLQDLDEHIAATSHHPLARMRPLTLAALRLGLCQLLFFPTIPPSAAVDETVGAFKRLGQPRWLVGFVHGSLRTLARDLPRLQQALTASGGRHNHPPWLVNRWQTRLGEKTTLALCRANNTVPVMSVRLHPGRTTVAHLLRSWHEAGLLVRHCAFAADCLELPDFSGSPTELPGYDAGHFHVQDEAAQLSCRLLAPLREGGRYLDACAGLGGKTSTLAQLLPDGAELTAVEPEPRRFALLHDNLARLGLADRVRCHAGRLQDLAAGAPPPFDGILLDVPCSGTGVIRRRPDIRWNRTPEDLAAMPPRQRALLDCAVSLLVPGGVLVYVTCSLEPEENEEVITAFLAAHPDFSSPDPAALLPPAATGLIGPDGFFHTSPLLGMDGFFAARLVRTA